jgi:hypothetical protein
MFKKKGVKVIEIRHKVKPTPAVANPLQSQINDLKETLIGQEAFRQKGYIELARRIEELKETTRRLHAEDEEIWEVINGEWVMRFRGVARTP